MSYASGKYAYGICDRCGFRYRLAELQKEWNNLKTCPECFESKSPQLDPLPHTADPQALYDPRPDTTTQTASLGVVRTNTISEFDSKGVYLGTGGMTTTNDPIGTDFEGLEATGEIGTITAGGS
jgi:hypothetical protein|tara:strand:+ start:133 stop:504 length:372 start_codon:yes stop_codon:yes gene_type:complete